MEPLRTLSHSTGPPPTGSRRGKSTRPLRAIFTKYPSVDISPTSMQALEVGLPIVKNHCRSCRSRR